MPFFNQRNILLYDQLGNLYNFRWEEGKIHYTYFDREFEKYDQSVLVDDCTLEFDAVIDDNNRIYFIYQRNDANLILMVLSEGSWDTNLLGEFNERNLFNLNILEYNNKIHILYCASIDETLVTYNVYHHFYDGIKWLSNPLGEIRKKNVLNPFQFVKYRDTFIFAFYNFVDNEEQIFIKIFDAAENQWQNTVKLTSGLQDKLYLDLLISKNNMIHLTYSEYLEGNLVIKHEKYKIKDYKVSKISENILSNAANCSQPAFVIQEDKIWVVWTEYDQIVSCFTTDQGLTWSNPYLWKESKEYNFFRYKFYTNNERIRKYYQLYYAFGKDYPEFSLVGFGPFEKAIEVPRKKKDESVEEYENSLAERNEKKVKKEANQNKKDVEYLQEKFTEKNFSKLYHKVVELEERIQDIEDFIMRRRRGPFFTNKK